MTTTESDKEDTFSRILEKAKADVTKAMQGYSNEIETPVQRAKESEEAREKWKKLQEDVRTEHKQNPLLYYSAIIHGIVPDYEFEEEQEDRDANHEARAEALNEERAMRRIDYVADYKPEGMTKTQWEKMKREERKKLREEQKQERLDEDYEFHNNPQRMYENMIKDVECECEAAKMRAGIYCDTCKLFLRLWQYTLDLFKDAAEGRSSYI